MCWSIWDILSIDNSLQLSQQWRRKIGNLLFLPGYPHEIQVDGEGTWTIDHLWTCLLEYRAPDCQ